jgi:hypothetical protein
MWDKRTEHYRYFRFVWRSVRRWCKLDWNKAAGIATLVVALTSVATLGYTAKSLKDGRKAFEATQRPSVSIGRKDGKIAEFAVPSSDVADPNVGIRIFVQNGGQSAALTPNLGLLPLNVTFSGIGTPPSKPPVVPLMQNDFHHLVRYTSSKSLPGGDTSSIAPQSEYSFVFRDQVTRETYDSLMQGKSLLLISGICEYCDLLGNYTCRWFSLSWRGPPFNEFSKDGETDCALLYSYPPKAMPDQRYLLPCEQPEEREAREKYERADILKKAEPSPPAPTPTAPTPNLIS